MKVKVIQVKTIKEKIANGREYRDTKNVEIKAINDNSGYTVEGYATTFDEPYFLYQIDEDVIVYEQISSEAFKNTNMNDVIMQYDHEGHVYARMSNNTLNVEVDEIGLKVNANLSGTTIGRQLQEEIDGGYTTKMSWGFSIVPNSDEVILQKEENGVRYYLRTIREVSRIYDVSAVSLPANENTFIESLRSLDGVIHELEADRLQKIENERRVSLKRKKLLARIKTMKGKFENGN